MQTRLRAAGFPEHLVRAIIRSLVNDRFEELWRLQSERDNPTAYWQSRSGTNAVDPATQETIAHLQREREAKLKSLLGPDGGDEAAARPKVRPPRFSTRT